MKQINSLNMQFVKYADCWDFRPSTKWLDFGYDLCQGVSPGFFFRNFSKIAKQVVLGEHTYFLFILFSKIIYLKVCNR